MVLILLGVFVLKKRSEERDYIYSMTTMSIERVTAKYEKDGAFYLTVVLDDFYHLPDQKISLQTTESIYENVILNVKYVGAILRIQLPEEEKLMTIDAQSVLKLYGGEYCEITALTLADGKNTTIEWKIVALNFLIFPVSESLNLYSNSSTHSLVRYKSIKQLKTKIQEDIY